MLCPFIKDDTIHADITRIGEFGDERTFGAKSTITCLHALINTQLFFPVQFGLQAVPLEAVHATSGPKIALFCQWKGLSTCI